MRKAFEGLVDAALLLWIALIVVQYLTLAISALWQPADLGTPPAGLVESAGALIAGALPQRLDLRTGFYVLGPLLLLGAAVRRALPERETVHDR